MNLVYFWLFRINDWQVLSGEALFENFIKCLIELCLLMNLDYAYWINFLVKHLSRWYVSRNSPLPTILDHHGHVDEEAVNTSILWVHKMKCLITVMQYLDRISCISDGAHCWYFVSICWNIVNFEMISWLGDYHCWCSESILFQTV